MRFASILDLKGNIIEGIMKDRKTSLESQKQQEKFCKDAAKARKMREAYDKKLGKVRYVHTERENVTQITVYIKKYTIFITMEPELSVNKKLQIMTNCFVLLSLHLTKKNLAGILQPTRSQSKKLSKSW